MSFMQQYNDDPPAFSAISAELDMWRAHCSKVSNVKIDTVNEALKLANQSIFPNVFALKVLGVLPVSTCDCEPFVPALRRLKTYMRSTMVSK